MTVSIEDIVCRELFLTSKVRLHCDDSREGIAMFLGKLFLTSKVRLHCDSLLSDEPVLFLLLFLTSKVRLHCDALYVKSGMTFSSFPDLKGQAPLRP